MSDHQNNPLNGRIGWTLAAIKQATPLFVWATALFLMFGFEFTSPGKSIQGLNARMDRVERLVIALVRLRCADISQRDAHLARLNCAEVFDR